MKFELLSVLALAINVAANPTKCHRPGTKVLFAGPERIEKNTKIGNFNLPLNYTLSFQIKPTGLLNDYGGIIQFNKNGINTGLGSRLPGIWFNQKTQLWVKFTIEEPSHNRAPYGWELPFTPSLQMGHYTFVELHVDIINRKVQIALDGKVVITATAPGTISSGDADLYVSGPWHNAAKATIQAIELTPK
jgi:hypothetical protein